MMQKRRLIFSDELSQAGEDDGEEFKDILVSTRHPRSLPLPLLNDSTPTSLSPSSYNGGKTAKEEAEEINMGAFEGDTHTNGDDAETALGCDEAREEEKETVECINPKWIISTAEHGIIFSRSGRRQGQGQGQGQGQPQLRLPQNLLGLTIEHPEFGRVRWLTPVFVRSWGELARAVEFRRATVHVLPPQKNPSRPPLGVGLNVPMRVTVYNLSVPRGIETKVRVLRRECQRRKTRFVSFVNTHWTFDVPGLF